jgi:hypothetical protein
MSLPGFSAEASVPRSSGLFVAVETAPEEADKIIPQQECFTFSGKCTGFWPWYQGTQCVTGLSGEQHCCTSASTYPAIRECRNPDGSWRVVSRWCGYCWW